MSTQKQTFTQGQEIMSDDLNNISTVYDEGHLELLNAMGKAPLGFKGQAFWVQWISTTTVQVKTGFGVYVDTSDSNKLKAMQNTSGTTAYTIAAAHATLDRIDIVQARVAWVDDSTTTLRNVKSSGGVVAPTSVALKKKLSCQISVKTGTAASSPAIPSTDSGYVRLAVVLVKAVSGVISQSYIVDSRSPATNYLPAPNGAGSNFETFNPVNSTSIPPHRTMNLIAPAGTLVSGDLELTKTVTGGTTFSDTRDDSLFAALYYEFLELLNGGYSIGLRDGAGYEWILEPHSNTSGATIANCLVLSGGAASTRKLSIKAAAIGTLFKLYRSIVANDTTNFLPVTAFTGWTTSSNMSFAFSLYLRGRPSSGVESYSTDYLLSTGTVSSAYPLKKIFHVCPLIGCNYPTIGSGITTYQMFHNFQKGRRYRITMKLHVSMTSAQAVSLTIYLGATGDGHKLYERAITANATAVFDYSGTFEFINANDSTTTYMTFEWNSGATITFPTGSGSGTLATYAKWGQFPVMTIQEI